MSAEGLVGQLRSRSGRDISLATLAACRTGVSSHGMPHALRRKVRPGRPAGIASWAGFVHSGR